MTKKVRWRESERKKKERESMCVLVCRSVYASGRESGSVP